MWKCEVCTADLQSEANFVQHCEGRKHLKRVARREGKEVKARYLAPTWDQLVEGIVSKRFRHIVVCTGAGVSTSSGIADFRSPVGLYEQIRAKWGTRVPRAQVHPEYVLSVEFVVKYPSLWRREVQPWLHDLKGDAVPGKTHLLLALLVQRGQIKRIYTQNVDGLHTHSSLPGSPSVLREKTVECHGSLADKVVLYGAPLGPQMCEHLAVDFQWPYHVEEFIVGTGEGGEDGPCDLLLVLGTSLQVAPFSAIPNLVPKGCPRIWITLNPPVPEPGARQFGKGIAFASSIKLVPNRSTTLRNLFGTRKGSGKWPQKTFSEDCDKFAADILRGIGALSLSLSSEKEAKNTEKTMEKEEKLGIREGEGSVGEREAN